MLRWRALQVPVKMFVKGARVKVMVKGVRNVQGIRKGVREGIQTPFHPEFDASIYHVLVIQ